MDFLFDNAKGVGTPLKIDKKTLDRELGMYTWILVDVDFANDLPEQILIQRKNFEFFVYIEYEKCPSFSRNCGVVGHDLSQCRMHNNQERRGVENNIVRREQTYQRRERQENRQESNVNTMEDLNQQELENAGTNIVLQAYKQILTEELKT